MSVMMTTDSEPVDAHHAGVDVEVVVPDGAAPGSSTRLLVRVTDEETGEPVRDLGRSHEAWMHLIATRADLGTFTHVHPEPTGRPGELAVDVVFPTRGRYLVHTEHRHRGAMTDVLERHEVVIGGPTGAPGEPMVASDREQVVDGVRVVLDGHAVVDGPSDLAFRFSDAASGRPLDDLQPYLGAAGHVVVMPADGGHFAHGHAEVTDAAGRPVFALPGQRFGPVLDVHPTFSGEGLHRLWGQFRLADGRVITTTFTVRAT